MTTQPSKPHLKLRYGLWLCAFRNHSGRQHVGSGYTPEQAYEDWKKGRVR